MSDDDKQALLDGTAAIQTKLIFHNDNIFDYTEFYENCAEHNCTKELIDNGIKISFTAGSDAFIGEARNSTNGTTPALQAIAIKVEPNTTYTLSASSLPKCFLTYMDEDKEVVNTSYISIPSSYDETSYTFTTPSDVEYIGLRLGIQNNQYTEYEFTNIQLEENEPIVLTEENSVISWDHEDFRYVKDQGWIGQFVARQVTGKLKNISDDFNITDKEFELKLGVKVEDTTNWYSLGNFLISKITDDEVGDITSFEALDYTKKFNKIYEDTIAYPCTALQLAQNVCEQCGVELATTNFLNNHYTIEGNVFTNNETCRDVMKAIGQLAFSWVRVDWDNRVYIDFEQNTNVDTYDVVTNHEYYNLKTQKESFGPVNRVIIGYSQIEGERTKIEDENSIEENGLCEITIYDNPLVYTQEQREDIIESAGYLFGLTYAPLNMLTKGHPWLKGTEDVQVVDMEGGVYDTIPFDRTIQYFGHIKTLINSLAPTKTNTEYAYPPDIKKAFKNVEVRVDKLNGTITEEILGDDPDSLQSQLSKAVRDINSLTNIFQITGGSNMIKNSQFLLPDKTWLFENNGSNPYHTELGEGYDASLTGTTVSYGKIDLRNIILSSSVTEDDQGHIPNINDLIEGQVYTLNFLFSQDAFATTTFSLIAGGNVIWESDTYTTQKNMESVEYRFVATNSTYTFRVETSTTSTESEQGHVIIYDLMLNSGDKKPWEPARSEIASTVLQMSRQGLTIKSVGADTTTLLNTDGINIYEGDVISENTKVTSFSKRGLTTKIAQTTETDIGRYVMKTITISGNNHHIEYFKGSD